MAKPIPAPRNQKELYTTHAWLCICSRYEDFVSATKCRRNRRDRKYSCISCSLWPNPHPHLETRNHPPSNSNSTNHQLPIHQLPTTHSPTTKISSSQTQTLVQGRSNPRTGKVKPPYRGEQSPVQGRTPIQSPACGEVAIEIWYNMDHERYSHNKHRMQEQRILDSLCQSP